jgi:NADH-quinone oxidoreductase subunit M
LRRFAAYASVASAGACLFGVAGFAPQGLAGAVAGAFAHGLAAAVLLGASVVIEERAKTSELARAASVISQAPRLGILVGFGLALSLGVPGLASFWGTLLVLLGGFALHPVLALLLAAGLVASAAAHARVARLLLIGRGALPYRHSFPGEALGSGLPDATPSDLAALVPVAAIALLLGVWPVPLLAQIADGVRDVSVAVEPEGLDPTAESR